MNKKILMSIIIVAALIPALGITISNTNQEDGKIVTNVNGLMAEMTPQELVDLADVIVRGNIVSAYVTDEKHNPTAQFEMVYTYWEIQPMEFLKGETKDNIVLKRPGGETAKSITNIEGLDFQVGDEVIFYLSVTDDGYYIPAGGIHTAYQIRDGIAKNYLDENTAYASELSQNTKSLVRNSPN